MQVVGTVRRSEGQPRSQTTAVNARSAESGFFDGEPSSKGIEEMSCIK